MTLYLILAIISLLFILVPIYKKEKEKESLLFLTISNIIFLFVTPLFYFYFKETLLAFVSSLFLAIYSLFLIETLKKENIIYTFPYLLFTLSFLFYLGFQVILAYR